MYLPRLSLTADRPPRGFVDLVSALLLAAAPELEAQRAPQTATQTVHFRVMPHHQAEVRPPAAALPLRRAVTSEATASYGVMTNEGDRKITASLDREMPSGTALTVVLGASAGAVARAATLSAGVATDVVTAIPATNDRALPARYVVNVSPDLRAMSHGESRTVIYTILAGP